MMVVLVSYSVIYGRWRLVVVLSGLLLEMMFGEVIMGVS